MLVPAGKLIVKLTDLQRNRYLKLANFILQYYVLSLWENSTYIVTQRCDRFWVIRKIFLHKIILLLDVANPDRGLMITIFARESIPDVGFKIDLRRRALTPKMVEKKMRTMK